LAVSWSCVALASHGCHRIFLTEIPHLTLAPIESWECLPMPLFVLQVHSIINETKLEQSPTVLDRVRFFKDSRKASPINP
jgi:hypothetical protein